MTSLDNKNYYKNFLYGSIAGISAVITSHPIDTIKCNIQERKPIQYNFKFLYRGLSAPLIGVGLEKSIVFGVFETTRKYTGSDVISGALSGMSASFVVTPFERIKILLQTNQGFSKNNLNLAERIESKNQIKFKEGLAGSFDLSEAQRQLYSAQQSYLQAMLDVINKRATLEKLVN